MGSSFEDLLGRANKLREELELFTQHVRRTHRSTTPLSQVGAKLSSLKGDLQIEVDFLKREQGKQRPASSGHEAPPPSKGPSGSNLLFFETLWDIAKRSTDIFDLRHRVCVEQVKKQILAPGKRIVPTLGTQMGSKFRHALVDLITDGGSTWVKISTITNRRLLFDLAKEAVFCGDSEDEDAQGYSIDDNLDIPLLKLAKELAQAASNHRIRTKTPTVQLVLPRIRRNENNEVDRIVDICGGAGVVVLCSNDLAPPPDLSTKLMDIMYPDPQASFSTTLNIDTSVIVALTSDFSHFSVEKQDWFDRQRIAHCDQETKEHFLTEQVYPLIGNHDLVCVREAVETYKHIVDTIGTQTEKARAKLILNDDASKSPDQLAEGLRALSEHQVPSSLRLPIITVDSNKDGCQKDLGTVAKRVLETQLNPGRSVFSFGWAARLTTITCNGVATKQLAHGLEKFQNLDDTAWPSIWACSSSRPLLGVPKASKSKKHIGDCATNGCTCGVESSLQSRKERTE
ncbi:uncharacterized protein JN550_005628 [Neoarthrinium moseri]|uniref:uncharacterized protein n=1 Tax=Neoarthrinium moseri TaxID=1658444 RepID=UPI001FDC1C1F|nr:uncharacterized protein JN550_005628 [Neoarthrinium moseri]KAI1869647.1 hypothetical protein JN550_005628 [Neoarthrinium moseri]